MDEEIDALVARGTWELVLAPTNTVAMALWDVVGSIPLCHRLF